MNLQEVRGGVKPSKGRNEERKEGRRNYDDVFGYLEKERLPARKLESLLQTASSAQTGLMQVLSNQIAARLPLRANRGLVLLPPPPPVSPAYISNRSDEN